jgi:hypothetical protein
MEIHHRQFLILALATLSWAADVAAPAISQRNDAADRLIFIEGCLSEAA